MTTSFIEDTISPTKSIQEAKTLLSALGWVVLAPSLLHAGARPVLAHFGSIVPQYDGNETFEVMVKPGFESVPYSQSSNGIGAHTEAPVMSPPPKYLALHCHRQARCGGGYTSLADGLTFYEELGPLKKFATDQPIAFAATAEPGNPKRRELKAPMLDRSQAGSIFRFSYNLFRFGDVNPSEDAVVSPDAALNAEPALVRLAELADKFFQERAVPILIPDQALLIWDNHRMMHARSRFSDASRHLTRYWLQ